MACIMVSSSSRVSKVPRRSQLDKVKDSGDQASLKDYYREAGKSKNTHDSYTSALKHYLEVWDGGVDHACPLLPASPSMISSYIVSLAGKVKVSTIRHRLTALSKWHESQGFYNPVHSQEVKEVIKGVAKMHHTAPKQAPALTFDHLKAICDRLEAQKILAIESEHQADILRIHRDLALILVGFWKGFRSDELSRVEAEKVRFYPGHGMEIFLSHSKTDTEALGKTHFMQSLRLYCPADALQRWLELSGINSGPVFRGVDRWGGVSKVGINKRTIEHVLNRVSEGLFDSSLKFSTHSLRRGFADWATNAGWSMNSMMDHVGWKSPASAQRYMPVKKDFGSLTLASPQTPLIVGVETATGATFVASHSQIDENE